MPGGRNDSICNYSSINSALANLGALPSHSPYASLESSLQGPASLLPSVGSSSESLSNLKSERTSKESALCSSVESMGEMAGSMGERGPISLSGSHRSKRKTPLSTSRSLRSYGSMQRHDLFNQGTLSPPKIGGRRLSMSERESDRESGRESESEGCLTASTRRLFKNLGPSDSERERRRESEREESETSELEKSPFSSIRSPLKAIKTSLYRGRRDDLPSDSESDHHSHKGESESEGESEHRLLDNFPLFKKTADLVHRTKGGLSRKGKGRERERERTPPTGSLTTPLPSSIKEVERETDLPVGSAPPSIEGVEGERERERVKTPSTAGAESGNIGGLSALRSPCKLSKSLNWGRTSILGRQSPSVLPKVQTDNATEREGEGEGESTGRERVLKGLGLSSLFPPRGRERETEGQQTSIATTKTDSPAAANLRRSVNGLGRSMNGLRRSMTGGPRGSVSGGRLGALSPSPSPSTPTAHLKRSDTLQRSDASASLRKSQRGRGVGDTTPNTQSTQRRGSMSLPSPSPQLPRSHSLAVLQARVKTPTTPLRGRERGTRGTRGGRESVTPTSRARSGSISSPIQFGARERERGGGGLGGSLSLSVSALSTAGSGATLNKSLAIPRKPRKKAPPPEVSTAQFLKRNLRAAAIIRSHCGRGRFGYCQIPRQAILSGHGDSEGEKEGDDVDKGAEGEREAEGEGDDVDKGAEGEREVWMAAEVLSVDSDHCTVTVETVNGVYTVHESK
ncbi:hypothetical protein KIPB_005836 [Kipferlia bialata]|uniref:Uncharacterized protein n=1 Tax=Kipferlia bialata TaxID=797122 RepID=A0A9K3CWA6_9EUKA|nr:hypothetical protein KIPB_005836 [Kipferlia bialata]|eukprot:g5836.t1